MSPIRKYDFISEASCTSSVQMETTTQQTQTCPHALPRFLCLHAEGAAVLPTSCQTSTSTDVPIHRINNQGSTGARPERVNGVTKGFAGLFCRQAPFNLLWKHLHTKAGTAAQLEPGFNVEELVPKSLKAAVGR